MRSILARPCRSTEDIQPCGSGWAVYALAPNVMGRMNAAKDMYRTAHITIDACTACIAWERPFKFGRQRFACIRINTSSTWVAWLQASVIAMGFLSGKIDRCDKCGCAYKIFLPQHCDFVGECYYEIHWALWVENSYTHITSGGSSS